MEKQLKYSRYNIIVKQSENEVSLFNTFSLKNVIIPYELFDDIKDNNNINANEVPEFLINLGFLVENEVDELETFNTEKQNTLKSSKQLRFAIAGTSRCNYNCLYCFEKKYITNTDMDLKTQDAVVEFIISKCDEYNDLLMVNFDLFGGEPCLCIPIFEKIIGGVKPYFEKKGIEFTSHIVTNGYLLTDTVVDELKQSINLVSAQITLDGLNPQYAELKGCSLDAFPKVIENIKAIHEKLFLEIRLNVLDNVESLKELITYLYSLNLNIQIYIDDVRNHECKSISEYEETYAKYALSEKELDKFIEEKGYQNIFRLRYNKHIRECVHCGANTNHYFVIDTDGYLYKCLNNIFNHNDIVGSVYEGITNNELNNIFLNNNLKKDCEQCSFLPICAGKCTNETIKLPNADICDSHREILMRKVNRFIAGSI